jgi:hypothetical protein
VGKYIERLLSVSDTAEKTAAAPTHISREFLAQHGF